MKYISTKTYKQIGPVAYRQWKAESHCKYLHGYALSFYFEFEADELDARNWVMDYGGLGPLKDLLDDWFDHKLLVSQDDPNLADFERLQALGLAKITVVEKTGCEGLANWIYEYVNTIFLPSYGEQDRIWCCKVEVRETDSNMAMVVGHREDREFIEDFVPEGPHDLEEFDVDGSEALDEDPRKQLEKYFGVDVDESNTLEALEADANSLSIGDIKYLAGGDRPEDRGC